MPLLLSLLRNKDARYCSALLLLGAMVIGAGARIKQLDAALAAKPKIEFREKIVERKVMVKVAGPVRIEEKIVEVPGNGRQIERIIYRDVVRTETNTDKAKDTERKEEPACAPAPRPKRWLAGLEFGPRGGGAPIGGRVGLTILDRVDLTAGYRNDGHDRLLLGAGLRF